MNGSAIVEELIKSLTLLDHEVKEPPILVAAHPRSGTQFMTQVLRQIGLKVGHERLEADGAVSWFHLVLGGSFPHVFHQVRNPLDCISSSLDLSDDFFDFMAKFIFVPERETVPKFVRCAYSWMGWNNLISLQSEWCFQVESVHKTYPELILRLKRCLRPGGNRLFSSPVDLVRESKRRPTITWEDLDREGIALRTASEANKYGYSFLHRG
jgi:hypothetical protein